jgi:CheY-like chemotaxis protein
MVDLLLIEDNADFLRVLREAVELSGYRVTEARNAGEGLARLGDGYQPAVIICDLTLPDIDGLEFLRRVRALPECAELLFIAMSGNNTLKQSALANGADYYLSKPFNFSALYAILEQEIPPKIE